MKCSVCGGNEEVLQEAQRLISRDRNEQYGDWNTEMIKVQGALSCLDPTGKLGAEQRFTVGMILLKISRELHKHKRDNFVDAGGYLGLWARMRGEDVS